MHRRSLFRHLLACQLLVALAALWAGFLSGRASAAAGSPWWSALWVVLMPLAVALAIGVAFWTARRLRRAVGHLAEGMRQFGGGDPPDRWGSPVTEEIGALMEEFHRMTDRIDRRLHAVLHRQSEQEAMLSSMQEGVLAVDCEEIVINLNDTCAAMLGLDAARVKGRLLHEAIRKPDLLGFVSSAISTPAPIEADLQIGERDLHAHGSTLYDASRRKIGVLVVLRDTTRLRRLETLRRDFVANVSHELKTPITSIKGFVETLLDGAMTDTENAARFLRIVLKQVNRLDAIIEDLLVLSRIERGSEEQTVRLESHRVAPVLQAAVEMCQFKADDKGVTILVQCDGELASRMNSHLLEQAVVNLVDNAIKYSPAGSSVWVSAEVSGEEVVVSVRDEGCGIDPKHLPRLFERFYRVDKARSRQLGGTGLGLAIVKHIALAHRGNVEVHSTLGRGSEFCLRLPPVQPAPVHAEVLMQP